MANRIKQLVLALTFGGIEQITLSFSPQYQLFLMVWLMIFIVTPEYEGGGSLSKCFALASELPIRLILFP